MQLSHRGLDRLRQTGDYAQDLRRTYYQLELIRKALYREARKGSAYRGRLADTLFLDRLATPITRGAYATVIPGRAQPDCPSQRKWRWMDKEEAEHVMVCETPPSHREFLQLAIETGHTWRLKDYDEHPRQAPVLADQFFRELHSTLRD
ncbi:hypothetical protein PQX77_002897 [Marasmius sp. AFHP31]|nr:hypothetical protein PQX77_002897 [Marasmius sp. AFHP31]